LRQDARNRAGTAGAQRWIATVNDAAKFERRHYEACKDVDSLRTKSDEVIALRM